ncbi:hypothetical protein COCCADRAFT_94294 [Bipolaris zeicola 26-R-13]|uniref:Uncharacterized protein n=1 Tax=Cochliobolus carbonum (strain 26-R-13) TaxID=930089 RepID=W6YF76_COCC2|nr:uncharacterized protein COCCADRAFT_94294 [Bipolaris zeicola 26-R-13]EUC34124.1 hypothetical protein COCCADRAFT_94294 [Bipolaris zeicola 26-R-13]
MCSKEASNCIGSTAASPVRLVTLGLCEVLQAGLAASSTFLSLTFSSIERPYRSKGFSWATS